MLLTLRSRGTRADVAGIPGARSSRSPPGLLRRSSRSIGLALVIVFACFGSSASAAVTGLQRYHAESASGSAGFRAVTASCPAGKQVLGGGAELIGGESQVALNDLIPNGALTSVTAEAFEDQTGYAGSWTLRAYAICATPPPGLERILATSPSNSVNKTMTATCPAGKRLVGAGGGISGGGGQVVVQDIRIDSLTSVTAQGVEDQDGTPVDWQLRVYAICSNPVHLLERVVATSPTNSLKAKSATATCPPGKRVVGGGGEVGGIGGQVVLGHIRPSDPLDSFTAHGAEDEDGTASNWLVRAFAICASVSQRVFATSPSDSATFKRVEPSCPTPMSVTGAGAEVIAGGGQVRIHLLSPHEFGLFADAVEDENGYAGLWILRAYIICATPLPGLHRVTFTSPAGSSSTRSATATCPLGERVVGAGGFPQISPIGGGVEAVLEDVKPNAGLTSVTVTAHEDETGEAGDWYLTAVALCAPPPPGLELVPTASPANSSNKSVTATCPLGKNLLGTGAEIDSGLGQVVLDDLTPDAGLRTVRVTGLEDETGHAGVWSLRSHAICASP